ncbi:60S ribosomal protein L6E,Ribosomal protein L2 domain 2,Translation protein SH3-like domain [Cinara cedri]|uniref:Large ribosomal subunit protein eL6 n=1 Tax=Cinara cedri TaxID=506608 RepID=A0A5E4M0W4_9HEMI|nr:60S ribosomal protein L6E,Ribosomal protein L2 domain 2,Translation protein SH3-like domain [Cinara cedri]
MADVKAEVKTEAGKRKRASKKEEVKAPIVKKKVRPSREKYFAKYDEKKKALANGTLKKIPSKKPKQNLLSGTATWKVVYKSGTWRFVHKPTENKLLSKAAATAKAEGKPLVITPKKKSIIVKPIKGEKNGGTREVHTVKRKAYYATMKTPKKHRSRGLFKNHKRNTRSSLTPGTVVILLTGIHKGKRAVLLKTLDTGLLLITGPFILNSIPLRRVHQGHVIATKTKLDISSVQIPEEVDDKYFKRILLKKKPKKGDSSKILFVQKNKTYRPTEKRKSDQKLVDKQILDILKKHPDRKTFLMYLASTFGLKSNQYPHRMQF